MFETRDKRHETGHCRVSRLMSHVSKLLLLAVLTASPIVLAAGRRAQAEPPAQMPPKGFAAPEIQPVVAELITEYAAVQPGGSTRIGVHFDIEDGWHIYAQEPGDAGLPTKIAWSGPPGVKFGELVWPPAHEFVEAGDIHTFGYSGSAVLYTTMTYHVTHGAREHLPLEAKVEWLMCKDVCIPSKATLTLVLPVTTEQPPLSTHALFFEQTG